MQRYVSRRHKSLWTCSTSSSAILSCCPCICSDILDNKIAALELKIEEVEAEISSAETEEVKARAEGDTKELWHWRKEKAHLRKKETLLRTEKQQLRDEKARQENQQQGTRCCSPLLYCRYCHGRASPSSNFRPGSIMMATMLPTILSWCGVGWQEVASSRLHIKIYCRGYQHDSHGEI